MTDPFKDPLYITPQKMTLSFVDVRESFIIAYQKLHNNVYPSKESLAILLSQSALETGNWKSIWNYNFGNIKRIKDKTFTMFRCSEIINGKEIFFNPPHIQTHFLAHKDIQEGADFHINFLKNRTRYQKAWQCIINGNVKDYSHELKQAGYYTASEELYNKGLLRIYESMLQKI